MILLPFESFRIISPLTPEIVQAKLENEIQPPPRGFKALLPWRPEKSFIGRIATGSFKVAPAIAGRNSFMPQIKGSVPYLNGSLIYVKLKLHPMAIIFTSAFCVGIGLAAIYELTKNADHKQLGGTGFIPFGLIVFLIVFAIIEGKSQIRKAENRLLEVTEGKLFTE